MIRLLPALAVLLLAIAATWYIARRTAEPAPRQATPTPAATATATAAPAAAATRPSGHRLAGTVVGDLRFAVIEAPDGSNELYAIDADVPGLGKLVAIGPYSATFEGSDGRFDMPLIAAPTPTPRAARSTADDEDDGRDGDAPYADDEELDEGYDEDFDDGTDYGEEGAADLDDGYDTEGDAADDRDTGF